MRNAMISAGHCQERPLQPAGSRLSLAPKANVDQRQLRVVTNIIETRTEASMQENAAIPPEVPIPFKMTPKQPSASWCKALEDVVGSPSHIEQNSGHSNIGQSITKERVEEINNRLASFSRQSAGSLNLRGSHSNMARASLTNCAATSREGSSVFNPSGGGRKSTVDAPDVRFVGGSRIIGVTRGASGTIVPTPTGGRSPSYNRFERLSSGVISEGTTDKLTGKLTSMKGDGSSSEFEFSRNGLTFLEMLRLKQDDQQPIQTSGALVSRVLEVRHSSPFAARDLSQITPRQITASLKAAYSSPWETVRARYFQPSANDVIVVSPPRTGQTPVLRAIDMMIHHGTVADFSETAFASRTGWIGSTFSTAQGERRRLYKTHMPLETFFNSPADFDTAPKIVVVLRDPSAVRQSWFRHAKAVFEHYHPNVPFKFDVNDFAMNSNSPLGRSGDRTEHGDSPTSNEEIDEYERFLASVLKYIGRSNVFVVFYEDLTKDTLPVLVQLNEFLAITPPHGRSKLNLKGVAKLVNAPSKNASTLTMTPSVIAKIQNRWDYQISTKGPWRFEDYKAFHECFSVVAEKKKQAIPVASRKATMMPRMSSWIRPKQAHRTSSNTTVVSGEEDKPRKSVLQNFTSLFSDRSLSAKSSLSSM